MPEPDAHQPRHAKTPEPAPEVEPETPAKRSFSWSSLIRPSRAQLVLALVLALVGFGVVAQVKSQDADSGYSSARREDLVQLLDQLTNETRRLEAEASELDGTLRELRSGAGAEEAARQEAERRAEVLGILTGTLPAEGPGIRMVITAPEGAITVEILLNVLQEMRDAGAEVIEINDQIRIVANSWIAQGPDGLLIDGTVVTTPITIEIIGEPHALSEAARFRGGLVSEITAPQVGGEVEISLVDRLQISSLHTPTPNKYAQAEPPG
ncbi:MAG TPA: DUF881 domain-containing protein [Candidatus Avipropionibacterium avicola]|uniref:DUF881 domain-containing protein n=1 Tax=Candidatus Avipropionibacterium avicola TaxID=2840701 RepID=A0A9D1GWD7_9ACTN|nr:DUF881 domain-containing protein [Candidatus Avipropionibacterium avicola]